VYWFCADAHQQLYYKTKVLLVQLAHIILFKHQQWHLNWFQLKQKPSAIAEGSNTYLGLIDQ